MSSAHTYILKFFFLLETIMMPEGLAGKSIRLGQYPSSYSMTSNHAPLTISPSVRATVWKIDSTNPLPLSRMADENGALLAGSSAA